MLTDQDKAFEFDRAKNLLRRTGRTGGLVYELTKLLRLAPPVTSRYSSRASGRPGAAGESQSSSSPPSLNF